MSLKQIHPKPSLQLFYVLVLLLSLLSINTSLSISLSPKSDQHDQCQKYSAGLGHCLKCSEHYNLDDKGICRPKIQTQSFSSRRLLQSQDNIDSHCRISTADGRCDACQYRWFSVNGSCIQISDLCGSYDIMTGVCFDCVEGAVLNDKGICERPAAITLISNCKIQDSDGKCSSCQYRFYLNSKKNNCLPVPKECNGYDIITGLCLNCLQGYILDSNSVCRPVPTKSVLIPTTSTTRSTSSATSYIPNNLPPGCKRNDKSGRCIECLDRYFVSGIGCQAVSDNCKIYNKLTGACQSCNDTFELKNGDCILVVRDPNCKVSPPDGPCSVCNPSYFLSKSTGMCISINPTCKSQTDTGGCQTCYQGYRLDVDRCIVTATGPVVDCKRFSSTGQCIECPVGYFISSNACQKADMLCKTFNLKNGDCTSCYVGFAVRDGKCLPSSKDPNCKKYELNNICTECVNGSYVSGGVCKPISNQCATYNRVTGDCLTCFQGYLLSGRECVKKGVDPSCKTFKNNTCIECAGNYTLMADNTCRQQNNLCKTSNKNNECTSCYPGYVVSNGACIINKIVNCKIQKGGKCSECASGFYLDAQKCVELNTQCKKIDALKRCTQCYPGFRLVGGNCIVPKNTDPNCLQSNLDICLSCANKYWLGPKGVCLAVNPDCFTYNPINGDCVSCNTGLIPKNGTCIRPQPKDPACTIEDVNGLCTDCLDGYTLMDDQTCKPISILCETFDHVKKMCTECVSGYFLQEGECITPALGWDEQCIHYAGAYCDNCKVGYYLQNYFCTAVDARCLSFDYQNNICMSCGLGATPSGPSCL